MGINDRSWRGTTQGSVTTLRPQQVPNNGQPYNPQQGSTSSRAYTPRNSPHQVLNNGRPYNSQQGSTTSQAFIPRNPPQAARTPASAPRPRKMNTGFNGSMATVHENEPQPQLLSIPVTSYNPGSQRRGGANISSHASNNEREQQSRASSSRSRASNFNMHQPTLQYINRPDFLRKHEFKRGMIINAPLFQEDRLRGRAPSENVSIAAHGIVYSKPRYMIVIGLYFNTYTTVSLYTHERKGLKGKENYKNEFISVRDGRTNPRFFQKLSDYDELVTDGIGARIDPLSTAWLTSPVSRDYDLSIKCHGRLTTESTNRLMTYIQDATMKGLGL